MSEVPQYTGVAVGARVIAVDGQRVQKPDQPQQTSHGGKR